MIHKHRRTLHVCSALLLFGVVRSADALSWNAQSAQQDARFYTGADRDFIGEGLNWSGIGVMQGGWATMISDHYFLSSYHIGPPKADIAVDFYRGDTMDTSAGNYVQEHIDPTFGVKIAGTDLWLGRMVDAPPAWVNRYPLIQRPTATNYVSYLNPSIYVYGYSGAGNIDYVRSFLGTNTINTFSNTYSDVFGSVGVGLTYTKDPSGGASEAGLVPGDSSGPTFVDTPSGLALAGLHWQINQDGNTDTNVSAYISQVVAATPEHVNVVTDLRGDLDGDYKVTMSDFMGLVTHFTSTPTAASSVYDLNRDGNVNYSDFQILLTTYGTSELAPADFNKDQSVDRFDMRQIGTHWQTFVTPKTAGDANGDGYVNQADLNVLNANWLFGTWTSSHPATLATGDLNGDGLVDSSDEALLEAHWNSNCAVQACGAADINHDGVVNQADLDLVTQNWNEFGPADINHDLKVDNYDLSIVLNHWGQRTIAGQAAGDLNGDGVVNYADFSLMADWWGRGVGDVSQQPSLTVVPEPATLLLAMAALAWGATRRRLR